MAGGYHAVWFLYKGAPWDIGRIYRPDGTFTGYYVDMLEPISWDGADPTTLQPLVDLFLDLWITPDGRTTVLDEDELAEAEANGAISHEQVQAARTTLTSLIQATNRGTFPPADAGDFALQLLPPTTNR